MGFQTIIHKRMLTHDNNVVIVIAKFKEDMRWINDLAYTYTIYDKSKNIPNVGREAETYLRYIIEQYDNLPDYVVFLQGNPFDHLKERSTNFINESIKSIISADIAVPLNNLSTEEHNRYTRTRESFTSLFDSPPSEQVLVSYGAQFIVPKSCITHRTKEFYELIRNVMVDVNNTQELMTNCLVCPWTLERMWLYIFDKTIKSNDVKYQDLL